MQTLKKDGKPYESRPEVAEYDDATEAKLVLFALRDALGRMNYACEIVIYTECIYVAEAVENRWPDAWKVMGWKNSRERDVADAALWRDIYTELTDTGHLLRAKLGKHEYSGWMQWKMPLAKAYKDTFQPLSKD